MTGILKLSNSLSLAIIFICIFSACSSKVKAPEDNAYKYASMKDGILHLDLDKSRKDPVIINLSDICDSLIYIPLETKKECLLGSWLVEFFIDGDDIFMQVDHSAYHFSRSGEFVCQYGKLGRGPKEYSCSGFALNTNDKRVYAKANFKRRLLEFDYEGRLISSEIKMTTNQYMMMYNPIEKELLYSSNYSLSKDKNIKTDYNILAAYDLNGKIKYNIKSKYFPKKFFIEGRGSRIHVPGATKYIMGNSIYIQELASDTVFRKHKDTLTPHIILNNYDFRKPFTSALFHSNEASNFCWMMWVSPTLPLKVRGESSRFIFIDYYAEPSYMYDKKERTLTCVDYYKEAVEGDKQGKEKINKYMYFNDMDRTNHIEHTWVINNKYLLSKISAIDFLENLEKLKASAKEDNKYLARLEEIAKGMTEESNPVIMLARLKK